MPFDLEERFLLAAEHELGARLPVSYRAAMLRSNGGEILTDDDEWELYPIADTSDRKRLARTSQHVLKETASCREWPRFPATALAIAGNGAGDHLVLVREGDSFQPTVFAWRHDTGALEEVAADFLELHVDTMRR